MWVCKQGENGVGRWKGTAEKDCLCVLKRCQLMLWSLKVVRG